MLKTQKNELYIWNNSKYANKDAFEEWKRDIKNPDCKVHSTREDSKSINPNHSKDSRNAMKKIAVLDLYTILLQGDTTVHKHNSIQYSTVQQEYQSRFSFCIRSPKYHALFFNYTG